MQRYFSFRVILGAIFLSITVLFSASPTSISAASPALRRYPYLTDVVSSYATINWATDRSETAGAVRFGKVSSESCTAHYVPATKTSIVVNGVLEYQWKAQLNLQPGTQYCYRVSLGTSPVNAMDLLGSDPAPSFWTQVPSGTTQPYSFVVIGDWGQVAADGTNSFQSSLMSLIAASDARFVVTTGDNGYPDGNQKNYGDLIQTGLNTSAIFGPSFWKLPGASVPIFLTLGNHGFYNPDTNHPVLITWPQDRAVFTSKGRYAKERYCCLNGSAAVDYPSDWYAFDAGPARFYLLEAAWSERNLGSASEYEMDYDYHWAPGTDQYEWLKADLVAHSSVLKFAFWHYPLYSDNPQESSDPFLQGSNNLEGLLKENGVDIAFTGHAHIYERNLPSTTGLTNYITGGGGAIPGTLGICTPLDAYAIKFTTTGAACGSASAPTQAGQFYHFLKVTVDGTHVTVTPINSLGQSFDVKNYDFSTEAESILPTAPAAVDASALSGTQVNLSWSASSDNTEVRGYDIYRDGILIATVDNNTLSYSDQGLIPATTYAYTVDSFDGSGNHSAHSAPVSVMTSEKATYTFVPVADAYIAPDSSSTNFGLSETLRLGDSLGDQTYIRFNVNDTHGTVTEATLRLYTTSSSTIGYQVHKVSNQTWEEGQITTDNAPGVDAVIGSSGNFPSAAWTTVDLTSLITGNGVYDLVLTTSAPAIVLNSRDASSNQPQLVIRTISTLPAADLALNKSVNNKTPRVNTNITFTLLVTNQGPAYATGVEVSDQLPGGFTFISSTPSQGTYNSLTGLWTVGNINANASATLKITAAVNVSGSYTNIAEINASQTIDPDSMPNNGNPTEDDRESVTVKVSRGGSQGTNGTSNPAGGFLIPLTGYAPNIKTELSHTVSNVPDPTALVIKIPSLSLDIPIVAVPYNDNTWDVSWLWDQAGWLQGTAFPTFSGNSVITGHLVTADGKPGSFYNLSFLKLGQYVFIDNGGFRYAYRIVSKRFVKPNDESILDHKDESWLTLVTCDSYNATTGTYRQRLVVQAEFVNVSPIK